MRQSRLLGLGIAVAGATAAAMIGEGFAHADTPDDVIAQATNDLVQGDSVLAAAPTTDLGTQQAEFFANQEVLGTQIDPSLTQIGSMQESLPAVDQTFLINGDEQLVNAAQNVLSADQALIVADQAGELSGNLNSADFAVVDANFGLFMADFTVLGDSMLATIFPDIGSMMP